MDYFDILLAKKLRGGGGGDITIKSLNVTQNGTYSEEGVAYSPVKVDVPLPENAYLLKEIEDVDIATFSDGSDLPMAKLEVAIEPVQEGSGDPSPTNIRPISGWDEVNVSVSGVNIWDEEWENGYRNSTTGAIVPNASNVTNKNLIRCLPNTSYYWYVGKSGSNNIICFDAEQNRIGTYWTSYNSTFTTPSNCYYLAFTVDNTTYNNDISINYPSTDTEYHAYNGQTYNIKFKDSQGNPIEVYGGECDVVNGGEQPMNRVSITLDDIANDIVFNSGYNCWVVTNQPLAKYVDGSTVPNIITSVGYTPKAFYASDKFNNSVGVVSNGTLFVGNGSNETKPTGQLVYELATPLTIQLPTTVVKSLRGVNNVYADSGDILDLSYFGKEV